MRNRRLVVVLGAAALLLSARPGVAAGQPQELPAKIVTLGGRAELSRKSAPAWAAAMLGDELVDGDGVRTLGGRLTVRTASGQVLRLAPRTQVFFPQGAAPAASGPARVRMDGGRLWAAVLPNSPAAAQLEIQAGPVTITARGGGAGVTMNADGSVHVAAYHGAVTCAGAGWARALAEDQELLVPPTGAPTAEVARLKRDKRDADWLRWNEQQDAAGGYGGRRVDK
jgi:hypothetical protein